MTEGTKLARALLAWRSVLNVRYPDDNRYLDTCEAHALLLVDYLPQIPAVVGDYATGRARDIAAREPDLELCLHGQGGRCG